MQFNLNFSEEEQIISQLARDYQEAKERFSQGEAYALQALDRRLLDLFMQQLWETTTNIILVSDWNTMFSNHIEGKIMEEWCSHSGYFNLNNFGYHSRLFKKFTYRVGEFLVIKNGKVYIKNDIFYEDDEGDEHYLKTKMKFLRKIL